MSVVSDREVASVLGKVRHVAQFNPKEGERLQKLADKKLPAPSWPGVQAQPAEFLRCKCAKKHAQRSHSSLRPVL